MSSNIPNQNTDAQPDSLARQHYAAVATVDLANKTGVDIDQPYEHGINLEYGRSALKIGNGQLDSRDSMLRQETNGMAIGVQAGRNEAQGNYETDVIIGNPHYPELGVKSPDTVSVWRESKEGLPYESKITGALGRRASEIVMSRAARDLGSKVVERAIGLAGDYKSSHKT